MRRRTVLLVIAGVVLVGGALAAWKQEDIRRAVRNSPSYARVTRLPVLDDLLPRSVLNRRLVTGIALGGTPDRPVLYVSSSDPRRVGGVGPTAGDTNSGVLSRLTLETGGWRHEQLVRGIPRSRYDHAPNGIALEESKALAYLAVGAMSDVGWPSAHFRDPEYALSAALLRIDLQALPAVPYDLPTLDDPTREGDPDAGDPFGGNRGLNQARLPTQGPLRVHAAGLRNAYDVVRTRAGRLYLTDNGANPPVDVHGRRASCSNEPSDVGWRRADSLRDVTTPGIYGGHPNPTRGGARTQRDQIGMPVTEPDPRQCHPVPVAEVQGVVTTFGGSTNGLTEYTASALDGALAGHLLTVSLDGSLIRVDPKLRGPAAQSQLSDTVAVTPLDVTAVGDEGRFPGSIWIGDWATGRIVVLDPRPSRPCAPVSERCFRRSMLRAPRLDAPTSIAWGPDGRLYVGEQEGLVKAFSVERDADGGFVVTGDETIAAVRNIANHDDDGRPAARLPLFD